jgi:hypothetical protein
VRTAQILTAAGFRDVRRTPYALAVDVPEDAIFDDIQLTLMQVPPEHHEQARVAVQAYLRQFELGNGLSSLPLGFQVVQADTA